MWVRSQDNERLLKVEDVFIKIKDANGMYKICVYDKGFIGVYSTKEKALKVLDMMHTKLNSRRKGDLINAIVLNPKISLNLNIDEGITLLDDVFLMPQDSEVE